MRRLMLPLKDTEALRHPRTVLEHGTADVLTGPAVFDLMAVADRQPVLGAKGPKGVLDAPGEGRREAWAKVWACETPILGTYISTFVGRS